jgi:glucosamine-phosphate N-acetyltransferase
MVIRGCRVEDFEQILKLLGQLWPDNKLNKKELHRVFLRGLNSEFQYYICATIETGIVGFGSLTIKNSLWQQDYVGYIDELIVDKQRRGKGIGSELLQSIINVAKERGCRRAELDSAFDRAKAHEFYQKNGFENRAFLFSKKI